MLGRGARLGCGGVGGLAVSMKQRLGELADELDAIIAANKDDYSNKAVSAKVDLGFIRNDLRRAERIIDKLLKAVGHGV